MAAAVLVTVAAIFLWSQLPPRQLTLASTFSDGTVAGVLHVHSSRSDGRGTLAQIAHDAARAGLKFIVITDHGDATRAPEPPVYREGVLCIDGTEISTRDGHYIAVDIPASPYPLAGDGRDVVEDVKRLGGFGIVAHPDSPKPELAWKAWDTPFDAVEILNLDTMWRRRLAEPGWRGKAALQARLLTYPFRPVESIASLVLPSRALDQWDAIARRRHVVTLAGADAHAQIAWRASDPIAARLAIPIPSYVSLFRALSVRVRPERALTTDAKTDAGMLLRAIRAGHLYTVVDGIATPPAFELTATNSLGTVRMGDQLDVAGPATLHVRSNAPDGFTTTIWNGTTAVASDRSEQDFTVTRPKVRACTGRKCDRREARHTAVDHDATRSTCGRQNRRLPHRRDRRQRRRRRCSTGIRRRTGRSITTRRRSAPWTCRCQSPATARCGCASAWRPVPWRVNTSRSASRRPAAWRRTIASTFRRARGASDADFGAAADGAVGAGSGLCTSTSSINRTRSSSTNSGSSRDPRHRR